MDRRALVLGLAVSGPFGLLLLGAQLLGAVVEPVRIRVEEPAPHSLVTAPEPVVTVRGSARGAPGQTPPLDLVLVLDVSRSTRLASGSDVDGDGETGEPLGRLGSTDPEDTVLHAEVAAARALLAGLPPRGVRLGLVTFSGASDRRTGLRLDPDQSDAWLRAPVGADRSHVAAALERILEEGPHGATNFEAGIRLASQALGEAGSSDGGRRALLFLTDGLPSFPVGRADISDPGDVGRARSAARDAAQGGIQIHVFALGPDALAQPDAAVDLARLTGGSFTALPEPARIVDVLAELSFEGAIGIRVTNLGTGAAATSLEVRPDGAFEARVPVTPGPNRIRVQAGRPPVHLDVPFQFRTEGASETRRSLEIQILEDDE